MAVKSYRIEDEPQPGAMAQVAVDPLWPLLGLMFVGAWFSWPWFLVNGFAVGSPTRWRELAWVIGGFVVSAAIILGIFYVMDQGMITKTHMPYVLLVLTVWKIGVGYALYSLQSRTTHIYEYYGGVLRNGLIVVIVAAFLLRAPVLDALDNDFFILLLG